MDVFLRSRLGANALLIVAASAVPAAAMHFLLGAGAAPIDGAGHLWIMSVGAVVAAVASLGLMAAGLRGRDGRSLVAGGAFAAMTLLLLLHGLATPGVLVGPNGVVALAGGAALPVGGGLLTLAALPRLRNPERIGRLAAALAGLLVAIAAGGAIALISPGAVPRLPESGDPLAWALVTVGAAFFLTIAVRAVRTWTLTRRLSDLVVVVGLVWLGMALIPVLLLARGTWAWWLGHGLEFAGVALVGVPLALDVFRSRPSNPTVGDLPAAMLVQHEETFLGAHVRALIARLEDKDVSTEQHTRRVAELAVRIGEELGLSAGRLRHLALAGLLHDIGKLSVPGAILTKAGPLTDAEYDVIKMHPVWGDELLAELGYSEHIRRPVRGHHERLDGSGYPDAVADLDLETRILAVADVYDALVSPRVYRGAWSRADALAHLRDGAGLHYCVRCVQTLERLVAGAPQPVASLA